MRRLNVAIFLLAALVLGSLAFGALPAAAEDDLGTVSQITEWGPFRYKVYQYPSRVTSFFFYPKSYVTFDIQNGKFTSEWMQEYRSGMARFKGIRRMNDSHQIEQVGEKLRGMMPWISKNKLVDKARN